MTFVQSFAPQKNILRSVLFSTIILLMALIVGCGASPSSTPSNSTINTVAGTGIAGYNGNGGAATSAELGFPSGVALDGPGNLYIADSSNNVIRKVTPGGTITTVAGNGTAGYKGNGGPATKAELSYPTGIVVDGSGNLYIADSDNSVIRKVSPAGTITTVAGNGTNGYSGNGGPATSAELSEAQSVAVDGSGNLYIADSNNCVIRKVTPAGTITTVAGNGTPGYSGNGGPATSAELHYPTSVALDGSGNLYVADATNHVVREVTPDGTITTVAGSGTAGYTGNGGPATSAELHYPTSVALDGSGNLYIVDTLNSVIRMVTPGGTITTLAGDGQRGYSGDGGAATSAKLNFPLGVVVDGSGDVYIADTTNNAIRTVTTGK